MIEHDAQMKGLAERVLPLLQEFGVSAVVIVGYAEVDGGLKRICIANCAKNPAFEDGLRPMIHAAHIWSQQGVGK